MADGNNLAELEEEKIACQTLTFAVTEIINRPGLTWRERIALLYQQGFSREAAKQLVGPEKASDY